MASVYVYTSRTLAYPGIGWSVDLTGHDQDSKVNSQYLFQLRVYVREAAS